MPQLFADFARLAERPGLGLSVIIGREDRRPELAELRPGEHVLLVEAGNLYAEGVAQPREQDGYRWWYGIIENREAIHDLDPDQAAPSQV
jgi:hypothetical protein